MNLLKLSIDQMNSILQSAKGFVKETSRNDTSVIHITVKNNFLTATAFDMIKLVKVSFPITEQKDCVFNIPLVKKFSKNDLFVEMISDEKSITFTTANGSQTYRQYDIPDYFDVEKCMPKPPMKSTIWMDARELLKALQSVTFNNNVRIDCYDQRIGITISNENEMMFILPINPPKNS